MTSEVNPKVEKRIKKHEQACLRDSLVRYFFSWQFLFLLLFTVSNCCGDKTTSARVSVSLLFAGDVFGSLFYYILQYFQSCQDEENFHCEGKKQPPKYKCRLLNKGASTDTCTAFKVVFYCVTSSIFVILVYFQAFGLTWLDPFTALNYAMALLVLTYFDTFLADVKKIPLIFSRTKVECFAEDDAWTIGKFAFRALLLLVTIYQICTAVINTLGLLRSIQAWGLSF